ncbi:cytochrome p450 monooxygenase [Colletotrichum karsti]|uniref:Cytochrome p450 monooxygenase n=1 Tax=Colletotrichum karsti TaxID=1095194 RepID=A0A9P6I1U2_9PEZI|nr:cytochrome p450 monooxygenase [Colletotrichum karsti]KAF9874684.1 cytochrome p450 monooxygenase [Colletotrichum karsti]
MALLSPFALLFVSVVFIGLPLAIRLAIAAWSSPLKHIPAPWYVSLTHWVLKYYTVTGQRMYYIDGLHRRYGPVIRITPNEVSVADPDGFIAIHRMGSGFAKGRYYRQISGGAKNTAIFTIRDPKEHATRRKLFARAFTVSSIRQNCEALVRTKVEKATDCICAEAENGTSNVLKWWTLMASDVVGQLCFGESFELLESGKENGFIEVLQAAAAASARRIELPWLHTLVIRLPFLSSKSVQLMINTRNEMIKYSKKAVENLHRHKDNKANLFAAVLADCETNEKTQLTDEIVRIEASNMLIAGSDTISNTLVYVVWAILKRPKLQQRLEDEVCGLGDNFDDVVLEKLPLLNAVIYETLRLYGAASGTFPRETPPSGINIGGYFIPGGIDIATQAYTMHRLPDVFPDPLKFDESRFLPGAMSDRQKHVFAAFGNGSRSCIGVFLAWMEMRLAIALLFRKCRGLRLSENMTDEMMHQVSFLVSKPAANRCDVTLGEK